jgi:hypothetical protein
MRRTASLPLPLLLTALLLAGCTDPSPMPTPPPTPSATPVFASDEEALAAAEEAYGKYLATSDEIIRDGGTNPERLVPFVSSDIYERESAGFALLQERSIHGTGTTKFELTLQSFDDDQVTVYACNDYRETDVVDTSGASVLQEDRETLKPFEVVLDPNDSLRVVVMDVWSGGGVC